jgi:hypothetical protein
MTLNSKSCSVCESVANIFAKLRTFKGLKGSQTRSIRN